MALSKFCLVAGLALGLVGPVFADTGIRVTGPGVAVTLDAAAIAKMPVVTQTISLGMPGAQTTATYSGPLLWTLLAAAHALDPQHPKTAVREFVVITGSDGYAGVVAAGEIAPEFENKKIILATAKDGKGLGAGHDRLIVPGDQRGGRSVRDIVSITVAAAHGK